MAEINIGAKGRACPRYAIFTRIASSENKIESKSYHRIARIYIIIYSERVYIDLSIKYADRCFIHILVSACILKYTQEGELQKCARVPRARQLTRCKTRRGDFSMTTISTLHL